jgi:hypothetical protein
MPGWPPLSFVLGLAATLGAGDAASKAAWLGVTLGPAAAAAIAAPAMSRNPTIGSHINRRMKYQFLRRG